MKTLKFRAWDKRTKQMRPVAEISFGDDGSALTILACLAPKDGPYWRTEDVIVHSESGMLMQYTGLKDRNGVDIYEGDIVQWSTYPENPNVRAYRRVVQWSDTEARFKPDSMGDDPVVEIIGNIYDNPDLLPK